MTKALVLSGGGAVGVAWQIGLAAGLARGGVTLREADFITGTSAGSVVGARIASGGDLEMMVGFYRAMGQQQAVSETPRVGPSEEQLSVLMDHIADIMAADGTPEQRRAALGRFALAARAAPEEAIVAPFADLKDTVWPANFHCPTIDAETGDLIVWDANSGVRLDRGIASSCCVPGLFAPVTINGRRYIDGGFRSGANADLAKGHKRVLIISLARKAMEGGPFARLGFAAQLDLEIQDLHNNGSEVLLFEADAASMNAVGANTMDQSAAPGALEAGLRQGQTEASRLAPFWNRP